VVAFIDHEDRVVSAAAAGSPCPGEPVLALAGGAPSLLFGDPSARRTMVEAGGIVVPVASTDSYFGSLGVVPPDQSGEPRVSDLDVRMLERAAMTIALVASTERAVSDADRRSITELLEQLVARQVGDQATFSRRARSLGLDVGHDHLVVVLDPPAEAADITALRLRDLVTAHGGLSAKVLGHLVAVVRCDEATLRSALTKKPPLATIGFAGPAAGLAALAAAYDDALACLAVLHGLGRSGSCATAADLGPFRFLLSRSAQADAQRFVRATIGPLIDHDVERRTDLVATASAFLGHGRQHTATARALHVHANTLYQRLDRISAQLGEDWRVGDRALDVHMALRIHELAARFEPTES